MHCLNGAFNKMKALVGAYSVIVKLQSSRRFVSSSIRYYDPMCRYPVWAGRWRSKCWVVTGGHRATAPSTAQYAALGDCGWIIWIYCTVGICAVQGLQESLVDFKNKEATLDIPYFQWTPLYVILRCTILSKPIIVTIRVQGSYANIQCSFFIFKVN